MAPRSTHCDTGTRYASFISSFVINPLSAGLFYSTNVFIAKRKAFSTVAPATSANANQTIRFNDDTYFRAITNVIFNISTSAWSTETYDIAPLWPPDVAQLPLGPTLTKAIQIWRGSSDIFISQVQCQPFTSILNNYSMPYGANITERPRLGTDDACAVSIDPPTPGKCGSGIWNQIDVSLSQFQSHI
jgi:hypothetical protein